MNVWEWLIGEGRSVLVLGAHADDIEIGCAGTVMRLVEEAAPLSIHWVVLSADGVRAKEALTSAERLAGVADIRVEVLEFRERYFPHLPDLKEWFDDLAARVRPAMVLCPWKGDAHQDHATVGRLAHETYRHQLILQYEIPKRDGDLGRPNIHVPLTDAQLDRKVDALIESFPTQRDREWFDPDTFRGLARLRGVEAGARWAEAFHCERLVVR